MTEYSKTKGGIIVPKKKDHNLVPCGYCSATINTAYEPNGRLHKTKQGKPICVRCRVLNGKSGKMIRKDADKKTSEDIIQEAVKKEVERKRIEEIALKTQTDTKTGLSNK